MDIPWGSEASSKFVTNVGLITSNGPYGYNIMAAEWTHHVSYKPGLIMVNIGFDKATETNIKKSKEFGVNVAAVDQNLISSIAGGSTGKDIDKIKVLEELGINFYKAKKIDVMMVKGAALNVECRVIRSEKLGDHNMFVGEALQISTTDKEPLIYYGSKYCKVGERIQKPPQDTLDKIRKLVEKYKKK